MSIASSPDNIRYNGTGIAYAGTVGSVNPGIDMGELGSISFNQSVTKSQVASTRNAARGVVLEAIDKTEASLTWELREQTNTNLQMALMAASIASGNQAASGTYQTTKTWVLNEYVNLEKFNVFSVKLEHGEVTSGPLVIGDVLTQTTPDASGKIAYIGSGYVEVVNVTGAFAVGETVTSTAKSITISGITIQQDVVITDSTGATRRVQGVDYTIQPKSGFVRKIASALLDTDKVSFDHEAVTRSIMYGLSTNTVQKKITFDTDASDQGPRKRYTFWKVNVTPNGEMTMLGDGIEALKVTGSVIKDTTQPAGQEYYSVEILD